MEPPVYGDSHALTLTEADFSEGGLTVPSHARPGKLFTANHEIIDATVGQLTGDALGRIVTAVVRILRG